MRRSRTRHYGFAPYVPVAERQAEAARASAALRKQGHALRPVAVEGRAMARTFWGKAWCAHLESYGDYANRLPRGRTYVRSGAVLDLGIAEGRVTAIVQGTRRYDVTVTVDRLEAARWQRLVATCAGGVESVLALLQGRVGGAVASLLTERDGGLFPAPEAIRFACSCPDWASMCKHVAAALYGVGARLDEEPELFFRLRGVDPRGLVAVAARGVVAKGREAVAKERVLDVGDLGDVFGIDLDDGPAPAAPPAPVVPSAAASRRPKPAAEADVPAKASAVAAARKAGAPRARKQAAPIAEGAVRTEAELDRLGIPRVTVAFWVRVGALAPGSRKGQYVETATAADYLGQYLAAKVGKRQGRRAR